MHGNWPKWAYFQHVFLLASLACPDPHTLFVDSAQFLQAKTAKKVKGKRWHFLLKMLGLPVTWIMSCAATRGAKTRF